MNNSRSRYIFFERWTLHNFYFLYIVLNHCFLFPVISVLQSKVLTIKYVLFGIFMVSVGTNYLSICKKTNTKPTKKEERNTLKNVNSITKRCSPDQDFTFLTKLTRAPVLISKPGSYFQVNSEYTYLKNTMTEFMSGCQRFLASRLTRFHCTWPVSYTHLTLPTSVYV